jgi:hypothetical protein
MVRNYDDGSTSTEKFVPVGSKFIRLIERADGSKFTQGIDGTRIEEDPDGSTVTELPDSTRIEKKLDGFSGQFIVTTTRPDNTKTVVDPDGKETFFDADGNTQKVVFPKKDGTFNVYDPNTGTTVNTNTKPDR